MKVALISDVHSNHVALQAVLEDINKQGIEKVYCLGDMIGYGPDPNRVFPIIRSDDRIITLLGNYEESVALRKKDCGCDYITHQNQKMAKISFEWTKEHISQENLEYIRRLPRRIRLDVNGRRILMVHGTPDRINGKIDLDDRDEDITLIMEKAKADILFCAHTHLPFHKIVDPYHILNPGSVGRARWGSPQASYAIVDLRIGKMPNVRFRFVDYDFESFAREIENSGMPKNNFAEVIRTGYWRF